MKLQSADKFYLKDRLVYTFHGIEGLDPRTLQGQIVNIDGAAYRVTGVETFAIMDATGTNFGLAVEAL